MFAHMISVNAYLSYLRFAVGSCVDKKALMMSEVRGQTGLR